jgi:hypothetical protein
VHVRYLVAACTCLGLAGAASIKAAPLGFIEGHVKIFPASDVNLADDTKVADAETAQPYAEYPLIIRSRDGEKEIARVTADDKGNYRAALPPGDYILDVEGRSPGHVRARPQLFTIASGRTVRVDMNIDTGIR